MTSAIDFTREKLLAQLSSALWTIQAMRAPRPGALVRLTGYVVIELKTGKFQPVPAEAWKTLK